MRRVLLSCLLLISTLLLAVPAGNATEDPGYVPEIDAAFVKLDNTRVFQGIENSDAPTTDHAWKVEIPDGFADGQKVLVVYAHGFVSPLQTELKAQDVIIPRAILAGQGFAWAASSYSANGYVIDSSVDETRGMIDIFTRETGETPNAVVIIGASMGGHVTGVAIERYPTAFQAAMPICGVLSPQEHFTYYQDFNVLAHAVAGIGDAELPVPANYLAPGGAYSQYDPILGLSDGLTPRGRLLGQAMEQISGGERPLSELAWQFWNSELTSPGGGLPFLPALVGGALTGGVDNRLIPTYDNIGQVFQLDRDTAVSAVEAGLNRRVTRQAAEVDAVPYFPLIEGTPSVPVLALHDIGDLFVPFHNLQGYAERVADNGRDGLLVTRAIRGLGHCDFSAGEIGAAFTDLMVWLGSGGAVRPAGDDVLDADNVARRRFGCQFTVGERDGLPSCEGNPQGARVQGASRVETSIAAAEAAFTDPDTVILARSSDFADALAAAALSGALDAPVILTRGDDLSPAAAAYLTSVAPSNVVLLGGEAALSADVAAQAQDAAGTDATVRRVEGPDRFATAAAIAREVAGEDGSEHAWIVRGIGGDSAFADGVAISALSAFLEEPVLLVRKDSVPGATLAALRDIGATSVTIIGGEAAVSATVATQLTTAGYDVDRVFGADRYATSAAVIRRAIASGMSASNPWLATGVDFPDALTSGPAAAHLGQVFGMVNGRNADQGEAVRELLATLNSVVEFRVMGGASAISDEVLAAIRSSLEETS